MMASVKFERSISLGTIIHLVGMISAFLSLLVAIGIWKRGIEDAQAAIQDRQVKIEQMLRQMNLDARAQGERLARIEGKLDTEPKAIFSDGSGSLRKD